MDGPADGTEGHGLVRFDDIFGTGPGQIPLRSMILSSRVCAFAILAVAAAASWALS